MGRMSPARRGGSPRTGQESPHAAGFETRSKASVGERRNKRELESKLGAHRIGDITGRSRSIQRYAEGKIHWDTQALLKA
jgi:hypothetical protein